MEKVAASIQAFCLIQLQILTDKEIQLKKEIQNCKIQKEFIEETLKDITEQDALKWRN